MAILNTNISECNARLVTLEGQPQDAGFVIKRVWPWIQVAGATTNDTHINTLYNTIRAATSVTNPKVNNDSYAGKFIGSTVMAKDENVDGTGDRKGSIIQTLTKVKTASDEASLGTPDKGADWEVLHYLDVQPGTDEHCYYAYRNLDPSQRATIMGMSIAIPSGYTAELKRELKIEADKTGTLYVVFVKRTWRTWTAAAADILHYGDYNNAIQTIRGVWARIKASDIGTVVTALLAGTGTGLVPTTGHKIDSVTVSENSDGSVHISRLDQKVTYQHNESWWNTRYGKEYYAWGKFGNQSQYYAAVTAIGGLTASTANSANRTPTKYTTPLQLWDWTIHKSGYGSGGTIVGESNQSGVYINDEFGYIYDATTENRAIRSKRKKKTVWKLRWFGNYSLAKAYLKNQSGQIIDPNSRVGEKSGMVYAEKRIVTHGSNSASYNDYKWEKASGNIGSDEVFTS